MEGITRLNWIRGNRDKLYARLEGAHSRTYSKDYMTVFLPCTAVEKLGTNLYRVNTGVTVQPAERYRIELIPTAEMFDLGEVRINPMIEPNVFTELSFTFKPYDSKVDVGATLIGMPALRVYLLG
jgi:hypothetical protein